MASIEQALARDKLIIGIGACGAAASGVLCAYRIMSVLVPALLLADGCTCWKPHGSDGSSQTCSPHCTALLCSMGSCSHP